MARERPRTRRLLSLVRADNNYYWTCSTCYWKVPMSPNPLGAIDSFDRHKCVEHSLPGGTVPMEKVFAK